MAEEKAIRYYLIISTVYFKISGCDCYQIFSDGYNIRFKGYHHDGSHYILFRQWKSNLTNEQKQHFLKQYILRESNKNNGILL